MWFTGAHLRRDLFWPQVSHMMSAFPTATFKCHTDCECFKYDVASALLTYQAPACSTDSSNRCRWKIGKPWSQSTASCEFRGTCDDNGPLFMTAFYRKSAHFNRNSRSRSHPILLKIIGGFFLHWDYNVIYVGSFFAAAQGSGWRWAWDPSALVWKPWFLVWDPSFSVRNSSVSVWNPSCSVHFGLDSV